MKRVFNLLVVDESGSMSIIERQALVGINETLTTIQKMQKTHKNMEQRVTLITFDSTHKNLFYDNVSARHANPLKSRDYNPCGGTPLYDAIGMGIAKINALTTEDDSVLVTSRRNKFRKAIWFLPYCLFSSSLTPNYSCFIWDFSANCFHISFMSSGR